MHAAIRTTLTAVLFVALGAPEPVLAQASATTVEAFNAACGANPDFFDFKIDGLENDPDRLATICGCLVSGLDPYSEADVVMLTKDLDGSATLDDRTAYGDYTDLEARALVLLEGCLVGDDVPGSADMSKFDAACTGGPIMIEVVEGDEAQRATICTCLSTSLSTRLTTADADVLAADLNGTATEQSHAQIANYEALSELAGGVLDACFARVAPPASP
jgi:hypothetical protein